jgi:hypothetical protein
VSIYRFGEPPLIAKILSDHYSIGGIYVQDTNRDLPGASLSNEEAGLPSEMTVPYLSTRMK